MKNKKTYYLLILDKSGSMNDCVGATIGGFNEQVQMIRGLQERFKEQSFYVSLTIFNDQVEHPVKEQSAGAVQELTRKSYCPNGGTALLDAIGESVINLKAKIGEEIERDEATAVVVILTDGEENASKLFEWNTIRKMIRELEGTGSWTFSFLGATLESVAAAGRMNIRKNNTAQFQKEKLQNTYSNLNLSFEKYADAKSKGINNQDFLTEF